VATLMSLVINLIVCFLIGLTPLVDNFSHIGQRLFFARAMGVSALEALSDPSRCLAQEASLRGCLSL